jgi:hypothetical protein
LIELKTSMLEINKQIGKTPMDGNDTKPPEQLIQGATTSTNLISTTSTKISYTPKVTPGLGLDLDATILYDPDEKLDASVPTFDGRGI